MQPPPDLPDVSQLQDQLRQLEELLSMPPEKLQKLRQTIEFIERMSPAEREAMHIRLSQITQATPALKEEIKAMASSLPQTLHSSLSQFWYAASEQERAAIRAALADLPEEDHPAFLTERIEAFIQHRDEVFTTMQERLNRKRMTSEPAP